MFVPCFPNAVAGMTAAVRLVLRGLPLASAFVAVAMVPLAAQSPPPSNPSSAPANPDPATGRTPVPPPVVPSAAAPESPPPGAVQVPQINVEASRPPPRRTAARPAPARAAPARRAASPSPPTNAPSQTPAGPGGTTSIPAQAGGQTVTTLERDRFTQSPVFSAADLLLDSPGLTVKQGNGPRDVGISIRGSNARNGFGIRNIVVEEDGFPVTQPDGLSRSDLIDPHAYSSVDVYRGPSSAMFGNYATGGALNFHTRSGHEINGFEIGSDAGGFGYFNNYLTLGRASPTAEYSLFASDVRGGGFIANSEYSTQTVNFLGTVATSPDDRVTAKIINNYVGTELPIRLSLGQFQQNPFQKGCTSALVATPGCATVALDINGFSPPALAQSAEQAGLGRHDTRTIIGTRWEHDFDKDTMWRTQFVFDDKNINQPTGTTSAIGDTPAFNLMTDITRKGSLLGLDTTHFGQVFFNEERLSNFTYNVVPGGSASLGKLSSYYDGGYQENFGARAREEVKLSDKWTFVTAAGVERTRILATNVLELYSPAGVATPNPFDVRGDYLNWAPEAGVLYRADDAWLFRGRVGTGYGTPQISNLTTTPQGVSGNNSQLKTQKNLGFDLGVDWTPVKTVKVSVTGFYEFFRDEMVTQSPGAGLQNYTFNVPASEHRGVEVAVDWRPLPGWRFVTAYTYDDQIYTQYVEQLSTGTAAHGATAFFNRAGNKIPGVSPNELTARLGYDQPSGPWQGVGAFAEVQWQDSFYMENANLLKAPGYEIVNLNVHYDNELPSDYLKSMRTYVEVKNVFNQTYVASANNITDSITLAGVQNPASVLAVTGTGSIYAGMPRTFFGGVRFAFR